MLVQHLAVGALALFATLSFAPRASTQAADGLTPSDMTSLRAAYEQGRQRVFERSDGTHQARTHRQQFSTTFDGRCALITPDEGGWTFGLELVRYGFDGDEVELFGPQRTELDDCRLAYVWDDVVTEWYVNRDHGLEHGFTVSERPQGAVSGSTLRVDLRVLGDLAPSVDDDGLSLSLFDARGELAATYAGLVVTDARGQELDARMATTSAGLSILVDENGATYPLTIDPIIQQAYLKASNTNTNDQFGASVAVDGETVVVGAPGEDSSATGVDGNQSDNSSFSAGAVYVFIRSGSTWSQQGYLKASNTGSSDSFGSSVSIDGDTIAVGAPQEDSNATGVNGDQASGSSSNSGAVYVFTRSGSTWVQQAYLKASNTDSEDRFGEAVAIDGETLVVAALQEGSSATGVNGNQGDDTAFAAGAVYVFARSGSTWTQEAYLKGSNTEANDLFGWSVATDDDTVVVGTINEGSNATGVDGNQSDNSSLSSGAVYVFTRSGSTWTQQAYLKASNTDSGDYFGYSVAIDGDTAVVGANFEGSSATGVNGNQADNSAFFAGAAYVFIRSGATWAQQAYLKASNTESTGSDVFGESVAIDGDTVVVGAYSESSAATGVGGNEFDNSAFSSGAAYVFRRGGANWAQQAYLKASNTGSDDSFGWSVDIDGDVVVVGALFEDSNATGVNANQADNSSTFAGAVYIFDLDPDWCLVPGCHGNTASFVPPSAPAQISSTVPIDLLGSVVNDGIVATYYGATGIDALGCGFQLSATEELLLAFTPFPTLFAYSAMTGGLSTMPLTLPNKPSLVGLVVTLQSVAIDTTTFASEFSDALEFVIRP